MNVEQKALELFEEGNEERLIQTAKEYVELRKKLEREAETDVSRTPRPTLIAEIMELPVEFIPELASFVENELSDFERNWIMQKAIGFVDERGNPIPRLLPDGL